MHLRGCLSVSLPCRFTCLRTISISSLEVPVNRSRDAANIFVQTVVNNRKNGKKFDGDVSNLLYSVRKINNKELTRAIVKDCLPMENFGPETFILALRCLGDVRDCDSALALYNNVDKAHPSLVMAQSLQLLLSVLKFSKGHVESGLQWYNKALADSERFPELGTNVFVANGALTLLLSVSPSHDCLVQALAIKDNLHTRGARLDVTIYRTLLLLASRHGDFSLVAQLHREFQQANLGPAVAVEAAFLQAAVQAGRHGVAMKTYHRIVNDESLGLTVEVVEHMMALCRRQGNKELCVRIARTWRNSGGQLSWPMCVDIVALLLTPRMLLIATSPGYGGGSHLESTIPGARGIPPVVLDNAVLAEREEAVQVGVLHGIVDQVCHALQAFAHYSEGVQSWGLLQRRGEADEEGAEGLESAAVRMQTSEQRRPADKFTDPILPAALLAPLAVLITHKVESDLLFARLDSPVAQPEDALRRAEHHAVVRKLTRDLAVLGRWRASLSLRQRMLGYALPTDVLHYGEETQRTLHLWSLLALLRHGRQTERADAYLTQLFTAAQCRSADRVVAWLGEDGVAEEFAKELQYIAHKFAALAAETPDVVI